MDALSLDSPSKAPKAFLNQKKHIFNHHKLKKIQTSELLKSYFGSLDDWISCSLH